jgi:hypothetical protein
VGLVAGNILPPTHACRFLFDNASNFQPLPSAPAAISSCYMCNFRRTCRAGGRALSHTCFRGGGGAKETPRRGERKQIRKRNVCAVRLCLHSLLSYQSIQKIKSREQITLSLSLRLSLFGALAVPSLASYHPCCGSVLLFIPPQHIISLSLVGEGLKT